jgi:hypothetical protein
VLTSREGRGSGMLAGWPVDSEVVGGVRGAMHFTAESAVTWNGRVSRGRIPCLPWHRHVCALISLLTGHSRPCTHKGKARGASPHSHAHRHISRPSSANSTAQSSQGGTSRPRWPNYREIRPNSLGSPLRKFTSSQDSRDKEAARQVDATLSSEMGTRRRGVDNATGDGRRAIQNKTLVGGTAPSLSP